MTATVAAPAKTVRVRDIAKSIQYGHTASAVVKADGPRFLRITDIQDGQVDWDAVPSCDVSSSDIAKYRLCPGDVVFARTGATTGKSFLIGECPEAIFASYLIRLRVVADEIDPRYLAVFFQSPDYWAQIEGGKRGIGQPNVNAQILGDIVMPLPPLDDQRKIVEEIDTQLSRLEAGVSALKRAQANLKRYRAAVLKAACEGRLVPTEAELARAGGRDFETGAQLLERISTFRSVAAKGAVNDELSSQQGQNTWPIPSSWIWTTVGQAFEVYVGATPSRAEAHYWNGDVLWVSSGEVAFCRIKDTREKITREGLARTSTRLHPKGTVLIGMIGEGKTRGQVALLDVEASNNQNSAAIRVGETGLPPEYVYYFLWGQYEASRRIASGNNQPALNKSRVQAMPIPLPPLAEQERIVAEVERRLSVVDELEATITANLRRATRLRQAVLARAFVAPGSVSGSQAVLRLPANVMR